MQADSTAECTVALPHAKINDANGKKCGIVPDCQTVAVTQQQTYWNDEVARAYKTKDSAKDYAKRSMMPEDEISRARTIRVKMSKENRMRARVQIAGIAQKYRAAKDAMLSGSLDKAAFEQAYKLVASEVSSIRFEFASRQKDIEEAWDLVKKRQENAEQYVAQDLMAIDEVYEQTLAQLTERYGKRIAYYQSLPLI